MNSAIHTALRENAQQLEPARAYSLLLDRLNVQAPSQPALVDRTIYDVLFHFLSAAQHNDDARRSAGCSLAVRRFAGTRQAQQIGLPPQPKRDEAISLVDDQHIKLVLVTLSQMALFAEQPLVLCFDQVENLSAEQMTAQSRFLQALLDCAPNLLVITCGLMESLRNWHDTNVIHEACWDRLAQFDIALLPVSAHEARQIVQVRLDYFLTRYVTLDPVKHHMNQDHLFPLGAGWFDEYLKDKLDLRPRQVIKWAREGWTAIQQTLKIRGPARWLQEWPAQVQRELQPEAKSIEEVIDNKVAVKLQEQKAQRHNNPETLPPDSDNLTGLLFKLLEQCRSSARHGAVSGVHLPTATNKRQRPVYQMTVTRRHQGAEGSIGVLVVVTGNSTQAAAALRRVVEDGKRPQCFLLVTDQRCPLGLGEKGKQYLAQLQDFYRERMVQIQLTFEQYAELDALNAVVGMALSQDLEIDYPHGQSHTVAGHEVIASHHRCDRYASNILLGKLLGGEKQAPPNLESNAPPPKVGATKDAREWIAGHLALTLGASIHELVVKYQEYCKTTKRPVLEADPCKAFLIEVAREMHQDQFIQFTPKDDGGVLLPKRK